MAGAVKIPVPHKGRAVTPGSMIQPVVVFGLLISSGRVVEAHSLQPSDPRSEAALRFAEALHLPDWATPEGTPQQHEVFVIARFDSGQ
jgi:hypothetical protein